MISGFLKSRFAVVVVSSIFVSGLVQLPAQAAASDCLRDSTRTSVITDGQYVDNTETVLVTFRRVGKDCTLGNFKRIVATTDYVDSQGLLNNGVVSNEDLTLDAFPNPAGSPLQNVNYEQEFLETDKGKFFQYVFIDKDSVISKSIIVAVYPDSYNQPRNMTVAIAPSNNVYGQLPYYVSTLTGNSGGLNGTNWWGPYLTYNYEWYNCGAPGSANAIAAIADPTIADNTTGASCELISTGSSSFVRGNLDASRPTNITNSVLVSRVLVTDRHGATVPFFSPAVTTSATYTVTSITPDTAYIGGGTTITVTGTGLSSATATWIPNAGVGQWLTVTNVSDTEFTFVVPAPTSRAATSAGVTIYTLGGDIAGPNTVTLTKDTVSSLSNLTISRGTLSPDFSSGQTSYTASVSGGTSSMTVTPTFTGFAQTMSVNGSLVASGSASSAINLNFGNNTITLIGTAEDTTTTTYTITVFRPTPPTLATPTVTATATPGDSNSVSLSWNSIANRSSYTVKIYAVSSGNLLKTISSISSSTTTLDITTSNFSDFITRTGYKFSVTAVGDEDTYFSSAESALVTAAGGSVSITAPSLVGGAAFEGRAISSTTTVDVSDIPTGDGRTLSYQWFGGNDANSLTSVSDPSSNPAYTPKASDRNLTTQKYLAVRVTATIGVNTYSFTSATVPVYTYPNANNASVTSSTGAAGTYTPGRYKVGDTVIGHPWAVMGTPWPTLNYQWYVCDTAIATATPAASCSMASGGGASGTANREGSLSDYDLPGHRFFYVVPTEAAGKILTFTATLSNEATTAQGAVFTFTQSRIRHSGTIQTTQTITFPQPSDLAATSADVTLTASSTSALAITYSSKTPTICKIVSGKLRPVIAGTCVITASQGGNATYIAATSVDSANITISKGAQATLSIFNSNSSNINKGNTGIILKTTGGNGSGAVTYNVTGTGCSYNSGTRKLNVATTVTPGYPVSCTATATKATDTKYLEAVSSPKSFTFG